MTRIGIILGSTRPNRNGEQVARWVYDIASRRDDAEFELVDLRGDDRWRSVPDDVAAAPKAVQIARYPTKKKAAEA